MKWWYDGETKMIQPILKAMITANKCTRVLITGNTGWASNAAYALVEKPFGKGSFIICQVLLNNQGLIRLHKKMQPIFLNKK